MPLHHIGYVVPNLNEAKKFFLAALAPLGYKEIHNIEGIVVGLGTSPEAADFWISAGKCPSGGADKPPSTGLHIAFKASDRETVDRFHEAALKAGAKCNGPPGLRDYAPNYYAAFVFDLNGNNIEVVNL